MGTLPRSILKGVDTVGEQETGLCLYCSTRDCDDLWISNRGLLGSNIC